MTEGRSERGFAYGIGFLASLVCHLGGALLCLLVLEQSAARAARPVEVFSVTLEGGEVLGGLTRLPREGGRKKPKGLSPRDATKRAESAKKPVSKLSSAKASAVESAKASAIESAKKKERVEKREKASRRALEAKKRLEAKKKQLEIRKKRKAAEKKKREALEKKRRASKKLAEAERKRAERERRARDAELRRALRAARENYRGESANAGGSGFGAATLGGHGGGGGTLASAAFIRYQGVLGDHIKAGWHWLRGETRYRARVVIRILPDGAVGEARIVESSGNEKFDDSVVRAVYKASPLPAPPKGLYDKFRRIRITFDSHE